MLKAFSLPPLGTNTPAGHRFTAMPRWIEEREPLLKGEWRIGKGRDDHLPAFYRHANPLVNAQIRLTGDCRGQTDTQIVAPLLDIENGHGHGHGLLQQKCLDISLDSAVHRVNRIVSFCVQQ
jgi:hypothetical protein